MIPLDRIPRALRSPWLPLALLLLALSTVFVFAGDRGYFYRGVDHNWLSSHHLTIAANLSPEHGFQRFTRRFIDGDGAVRYSPYNRFPPGGYLLIKLAVLPFGGSPSAQLYAARVLMLLFFAAAAVIAYLSLCRLTSNRWVALTATLLAFSSYYLLYSNDTIAPEVMPDIFGVLLVFHGMVVFVQEGRFRQLLVKACIALLLGWHVFALLLPFVIFGLVSDLLRVRSAAATSTPPPPRHYVKLKHAASALLRSRYLLLGAVALGFGLSLLTFNFTMEYIALDGETPLAELPSFQSMLRRIGSYSENNVHVVASRPWDTFLEEQFRSIVRMFIPYSLIARVGVINSKALQREFRNGVVIPMPDPNAAGAAKQLSGSPGIVLGVVLTAVCLIGSMFVHHRILFATLASSGFFWAVPMHNYTAIHDFERIYYIGLPLVFFAVALLLARRVTNRDGVVVAAAAAALLLFAASSFQMSHVGHSAESARRARAGEQDLLVIRELTAGEPVTVVDLGGNYKLYFRRAGHAMNYYLNSSLIDYSRLPPAVSRGFVVMRERIDTDTMITPQNQVFFLYDAHGLPADLLASYRSSYRSIASTEPIAREEFDVYLDDNTVYYLKDPCERGDTAPIFFLHVFPENLNDLSEDHRQHGFDNLDFFVRERSLLFDGKCLARVALPQYDIAGVRTGWLHVDTLVWSAAHVVQGPKLISEYQTIVSDESAARAEFDLYIREGNLYYVKEPCDGSDVQEDFFLHVFPEDFDDLPEDRRQHGFDNLDFGFDVRGVVFDGKCLAGVGLPQYGIARIVTGQFDGAGRVWEVEFAPEARE